MADSRQYHERTAVCQQFARIEIPANIAANEALKVRLLETEGIKEVLTPEEEHSAYVKIDSKVTNRFEMTTGNSSGIKNAANCLLRYAYQAYKVSELQTFVGRIRRSCRI